MSERKIFAEEIHKRATKKFTRRKVTVHRMDETWGLDLAQMTESGGYKFILCIIDVFSKFAWCVPMKNKSASTVLTALKEVVEKSGRMPEKIWVDQGSEFYNKDFKAWAKSNDIIMYSTFGESKSVVVERFIRTLKEFMQSTYQKKDQRTGSQHYRKLSNFIIQNITKLLK